MAKEAFIVPEGQKSRKIKLKSNMRYVACMRHFHGHDLEFLIIKSVRLCARL